MPKVRRITDAKTLNKIVNRPDVLPLLAPDYESLDMSGFFKNPNNTALKYGRVCVLVSALKRKKYDFRYIIPEDLRGADGLRAVKEIVNYAFTELHAEAILGKVPVDHIRSRVFARALGAMPSGKCRDASGARCIKYILERAKWEYSAE